MFAAEGLDTKGRERVRNMLKSDDADQVVLGCQISATTQWRSSVQNMRRLVDHPEAAVRAEVARALGVLAGRAMVPIVRRLLADDDSDVRAAAQATYDTMMG